MDEVIEFIRRRWRGYDANWLNGNCYWFARILCERFPYLQLYYQPVIGHFVAGARGKFYDYLGANVEETPILWEDFLKQEPKIARLILRDCRD